MRAAGLVLVLVLAGCARSMNWAVPAGQEGQWRRDHYVCAQESRTYGGGTGLPGVLMLAHARREADRLYALCMEARDWRQLD